MLRSNDELYKSTQNLEWRKGCQNIRRIFFETTGQRLRLSFSADERYKIYQEHFKSSENDLIEFSRGYLEEEVCESV